MRRAAADDGRRASVAAALPEPVLTGSAAAGIQVPSGTVRAVPTTVPDRPCRTNAPVHGARSLRRILAISRPRLTAGAAGVLRPTRRPGDRPADPRPSPGRRPPTRGHPAADKEQRRTERADRAGRRAGQGAGHRPGQGRGRAGRRSRRRCWPAAKAERQARSRPRLDQAVKDGKLTQEQADAILKAAEAGVLPGGGRGGRPRRPG